MFLPSATDEEARVKQGRLQQFMTAIRLQYRLIVESGLRNPEENFDPSDYFGYCLPMMIPTNDAEVSDKMVPTIAFGLVHIKDYGVFESRGGIENAHLIPQGEIRAVTLRMFAFEHEDWMRSNYKFPAKINWYRCWTGMKGWIKGAARFHSIASLERHVVKNLLMTPVITEDKAAQATADLLKKFQGGN
jgi:hypothetical protein